MDCTQRRLANPTGDIEPRARQRRRPLATLTSLAFALGIASTAYAGETVKIGEEGSLTLGVGLRTSYTNTENGAPNGSSYSNEFDVENFRIFVNGTWGKYIKGTLNTEKKPDDSLRVMDAIVRFEYNDLFNLWGGRTLPPSDRANLAGPFYVLPWAYPGIASNYPGIVAGRDDGGMIWGRPMAGKIVYSAGAFNGHNRASGLSNESNNLLFAGRLHFNFLDVEPPPAYYLGETYFGAKDIFSVGIAGNYQKDGAGTAAQAGDLKIWNVDVMFEKKMGGVVPTLQGAYYSYDTGGAVDCGSGEPGSIACPSGDNVGGQVDGKAWMVTAGLLFPTKIGWGMFQPYVRYQKYERDLSGTDKEGAEFGVNYIINGSNAKVTAAFTKFKDTRLQPAQDDWKQFVLGVQLQF